MAIVSPRSSDPPVQRDTRGARLQSLRKRVGLTQAELGARLGLNHKTISAYENDRATLGSDDFERWARALGVSVAELTNALGFGLPAGSGCLRAELAAILGPDNGEEVERLIHSMADLPPTDQRQILDTIRYQVSGRHADLDRRD